MQIVDDPTWRDRFTLTASALTSAERNALARAADAGRLLRVSRGAYVDASSRLTQSRDRAYRDLVHARHLISPSALVFSHASAAVLWRLPRIGVWPGSAHVLSARPSGRSGRQFVQHLGPAVDSTDSIDGVTVTSLARTLIDLARTESVSDALVAMDAGLAGVVLGRRLFTVSREQCAEELARVGSGRGVRSARFAIEFADAESESPGETLSRLSIARAGLTAPVLQQRFVDAEGRIFTDFWWPEWGVAGEFDGVGKYLREEWTDGRSAAEVVIDEKRREDRLRRQVSTVVRWGWDVAGSASRLGRLLREAGVG
jgi:hypothetical protein